MLLVVFVGAAASVATVLAIRCFVEPCVLIIAQRIMVVQGVNEEDKDNDFGVFRFAACFFCNSCSFIVILGTLCHSIIVNDYC